MTIEEVVRNDLTPEKARIKSLQGGVERARQALCSLSGIVSAGAESWNGNGRPIRQMLLLFYISSLRLSPN
jgi:hypothetical protein